MLSLLINAISNSMQLAIIAIGFGLILSVAGVANFAYGALYLLGGFIVWFLTYEMGGVPFWLSVIIAIVVLFLLSVLIYRYAIQRIRGAVLSEVIVTIGLGIFIIESIRSTGLIGIDEYIQAFIPGYVTIMGIGIETQRLMIIPVGLVLFLGLWLLTRYTKIGLAFRAMSQDELTALSIGINTNSLAMIAMGLSAVLAVIAALSIVPLGLLHVDSAYDVLTYALAISVLGGLGSTLGIIVGAFILGFAQTLTATFISQQWTIVVTFLIIVLVLIVKPSGIFGQQKQLEERV